MPKRQTYTLPMPYQKGDGTPGMVYGFSDNVLVDSGTHRKEHGHYTSGGGLFIRKRYASPHVGKTLRWIGPDPNKWIGNPVFAPPGSYWTSPPAALSWSEIGTLNTQYSADAQAFGATGWKRARPGNPTAGLATSLIELKDGLPTLPLRLFYRLRSLRSTGSEYLNAQFGWAPLLKDIRDMYKTYKSIDKKLAQIVRDNGKGVHRHRVLRDSTTTTGNWSWERTYPFGDFFLSAPPNWAYPGYSYTTEKSETIEKVWFCGKFRYYIPDIGSSEWTTRATRALYGANVTPEVLYNVLPWTWLFDWFGNVGDVMSNMSSNAVDNLTADYAFIMRTVETRTTWTNKSTWPTVGPSSFWNIPGGSAEFEAVTKTVYKSRVAASPFGFGLTFDGLTPYQLGIVAALGISRWA